MDVPLSILGIRVPSSIEGSSLLKQILKNNDIPQANNNSVPEDDQTVELPFATEEMDRLRSLGYLN